MASAIEQARAAAGDLEVQIVGGANVIQEALRAGLIDELHIDLMPVLLGDGLRLFGRVDTAPPQLSLRNIEQQGQRTGLRCIVER